MMQVQGIQANENATVADIDGLARRLDRAREEAEAEWRDLLGELQGEDREAAREQADIRWGEISGEVAQAADTLRAFRERTEQAAAAAAGGARRRDEGRPREGGEEVLTGWKS